MKIAIHHRPGSFGDKWIEYCEKHHVPYKLVNCYASDIIEQVKDCDGLMWHWVFHDYRAVLFARQLTYSLEAMGKKVFPDSKTCWHYDDKVGQKYLLESIGAPLVPSYVFYDRKEALEWAKKTHYPKIFKLRGGAGSVNVRLVKNLKTAKRLIDQAFNHGFSPISRVNLFKERVWRFRRDKNMASFFNISKGIGYLCIPTKVEKNFPTEKNYVYFQDFIPGNDHDIRIVVIGQRAFAITRMVRKGDFRASGSGAILYDPIQIPEICVKIAFDLSKKLKTQSLAYDFVFSDGEPLLVEISYTFVAEVYLPCPGYWNKDLKWIEGSFDSRYFMVEEFIRECRMNAE